MSIALIYFVQHSNAQSCIKILQKLHNFDMYLPTYHFYININFEQMEVRWCAEFPFMRFGDLTSAVQLQLAISRELTRWIPPPPLLAKVIKYYKILFLLISCIRICLVRMILDL